jgi:hypothetical protein
MNGPIAPDLSDLVVGTMRPPAWVGRVPRVAWLFVALAIADVAFRVTSLGFNANGDAVSVGLGVVALGQPAAVVLLPAAVALRRARDRGSRAARLLFLGTVLLAIAELIRVGADAAAPLISPVERDASFDPTAKLAIDGAVALASHLVALGGIALVAFGVRASTAARTRSSRHVLPIAILGIVTLTAFSDLSTLAAYAASATSDLDVFLSPTALFATGVAIAERFGWGIVAALAVFARSRARASRSGARGWAPMAVGTILIAISTTWAVAGTAVFVAAFGVPVGPGDQQLRDVYFAIGHAVSAARLAGLVLVAVGLALGLEASTDGDSTEPGDAAGD